MSEINKIEVSDNEVLQVMTTLGLDAECIVIFRTVRHFMKHGVPPCCIAFYYYLSQPIAQCNMSYDRAESYLYDQAEIPRGLKADLARIRLYYGDYGAWALASIKSEDWDKVVWPCPSCVLSKNFKYLPPGCPCCADKEEYPGND
jgi:hypothetical protein